MSSFYPRRNVDNRGGWFPSIFGMNPFNMMPSTMSDIFDPINLDIDRLLDRSLHWINVPKGRQQQSQQTRQRQMPRQQQSVQQQQRQQQLPKHLQQQTRMMQQQQQQVVGKMPQKFRILIDCSSCNPKTLKTHIKTVNDQKHLIVCADEQKIKKCEPSYINKQFKRTYTLPKQVEVNKMISFVTPNGQFVVEFPLQEVVCCLDIDMVPKIEKTPQGRIVSLRVPIPLNVDPAKVTLMVKGCDVILRFEDRFGTEDCVSRVYFYNRCQLPDGADLNKIKCSADKHRLIITAPLRTDVTTGQLRQIPIQRKIRHKTLMASSTGGISGSQKQSMTQQKNKNVLSSSTSTSTSKVSSRSKSPITTEQQKKSSIKSTDQRQKSPIQSEQQKQKSPIKDTQQQQTSSTTAIGKKQKKSTTGGETGSDILKSVFGSGSQSPTTEKKQKSKSTSDVVKSDFPLLPTDGKQSESSHQQQQ